MCELMFNYLRREVQFFRQQGSGYRTESVPGHFRMRVVTHADERRVQCGVADRPLGIASGEHMFSLPRKRLQIAQDRHSLPRQRNQVFRSRLAGCVSPFGLLKVDVRPLRRPQFTGTNEDQRRQR